MTGPPKNAPPGELSLTTQVAHAQQACVLSRHSTASKRPAQPDGATPPAARRTQPAWAAPSARKCFCSCRSFLLAIGGVTDDDYVSERPATQQLRELTGTSAIFFARRAASALAASAGVSSASWPPSTRIESEDDEEGHSDASSF